MSSSSRQVALRIFASFLVLSFCFEQVRLITGLLARYTNEDHTLIWLMASDWARLRPHEPTFYGQPYGVNIEAIPMAMLHAIGVAYGAAFPVALIAMASLAWVVLAWAAWRRAALPMLIAALAAPLLLNIEHWIIVGVIGTGAGRLLAAVAVALALQDKHTPLHAFAVIATGVLAVQLDTAAATLAFPGLVWACLGFPRQPKLWLAGALGLLPTLAWRAYVSWFDRAYPDHALHPPPTFDPTWSVLEENLTNPDRLFAQHGLELLQYGALVLVLFVACWLVTLGLRAYRELAATSCALALVLGLASLPKTLDSMNSIWFPSARMSMTTPMALWFVGLMAYFALRARAASLVPVLKRVGLAAVIVLSVWTFGKRAYVWEKRLGKIEQAGLSEGRLPLRTVADIERICSEADAAARDAQTRIVVFPNDRSAAYGCPALKRGLLTAFPGYERRYWVLRRLAAQPVDRMLIWGIPSDTCNRKRVRRAFQSCAPVADGQALRFDFRKMKPALEAMLALGIKPRPFGADCNPHQRETCKWWAARYQ
jgi:hypothetical protein